MKNIIAKKDSIRSKYAGAVYTKFKEIRYGISCGPAGDLIRLGADKQLVDWQSQLESNIINETDITLISSLPAIKAARPFIIGGLHHGNKTHVQLQYELGRDEVIIDSDGCQTTVVINPTACPAPAVGFTYTQGTPATIWSITHNLGYVPNVRLENTNGDDIDGLVSVLSPNIIQITFSTAVAGKAYLS